MDRAGQERMLGRIVGAFVLGSFLGFIAGLALGVLRVSQ